MVGMSKCMNKKTKFDMVAGTVFLIVAVVHLLRIILGWEISINGMTMPFWPSYIAVIVAGSLAYYGLCGPKRTM